MTEYCCKFMQSACMRHPNVISKNSYGLYKIKYNQEIRKNFLISSRRDGSFIFEYCPWCGTKL